ncbi:patatin-like phospholipase family protein [Paucibacter sp. B2R-40]|uniref:patatin-like phospholipase family protein n=1 Tax=Paucibacter sp. B2R-40 TaxID=2893554 RepID=UPI0021E3B8DB|nr:patatin-like phospholipase family protein [Paucibacter sp. B2R-40]MCV2356865.1 patatin-like phospholipase family protein [Paucibacter sp. B2R-40]
MFSPHTRASGGFTLVLGSGGVKSIASLGLMQVLEREGLRPARVVGCSAGAIFGALLACGLRAEEAIERATRLWSPEVTRQRRLLAWLQIAAPRLAGFDAQFAMRDDRLINARLHEAFGNQRIENLPLPFAAQATCARSGAGVLLREGSLTSALRASMALPFLFAAHSHAGQLLVDGSLSDPLPLAAVPGPEVVLALGFRVPRPRQLSSASRLATQITATLSNNLLDSQLQRADAARTVLLLPELDRRVGLFDTAAMPYLLQLGREAAQAALPRLHALLRAQSQPPAERRGGVAPLYLAA